MHARIPWIVAALVAVAAAAWLLSRNGAAPRPRPNPDATQASDTPSTRPPRSPIPPRPPPGRFSGLSETRETSVTRATQEWGAEPRDDRWADETERELGARVGPIAEELGVRHVVGCRTERCAVTLFADTEYALGTVIARLEEPDGLSGYAEQIVLGAAEVADDGSYVLTLYADFTREE